MNCEPHNNPSKYVVQSVDSRGMERIVCSDCGRFVGFARGYAGNGVKMRESQPVAEPAYMFSTETVEPIMPIELTKKPSVIVAHDTTNRIHMLWHAIRKKDYVIEALMLDLAAIERECKAETVFCAFDSGRTFRHELTETYKANRSPMDAELRGTLEACRSEIGKAKYVVTSVEGFEADDVMATIAKRAIDQGKRCVIASPDKDLRQCLRPGLVSILYGHRRDRDRMTETKWMTADLLKTNYGFDVDKWIDFQTLVGDATDGIKGWAGVGEKTAQKWLSAATVDEIIATPGLVPMSAAQEKAGQDFVSRLPLIRQLVTLRDDVVI